ncbi:MAG: EAL domain-containing protein [Erysipelotrichaceae bacterium]|nr:EAL domain-containing protein [Erysipelotrichaceae bacterium]
MNLKKTAIILSLSLIAFIGILMPNIIKAQDQDRKVVKVGWYESSYNSLDENGFRSGYAYEYQLKLSAYNGWTFEYIEGSWPELLHKLETGEIDLMSDISYTPERAEKMLYSSLPMGTEEYYLFTAPERSDISPFDRSTLNGKKISVNEDSYQLQLFLEWIKENDIDCEVYEVSCTEDESLQMLENGTYDGYVTVDSFMDTSRAAPVYKIGSSDYYFAVNMNRPDLYEELEYAMSKIQDENRFYNNEMYEKYIRRSGANAFLSPQEKEWLKFHPTIKIGYQDNYLAFCARNPETGELDGVLKEYLEYASDAIYNVRINFKPVCYATAEEALDALHNGEVDCVFPANFSGYEAESLNIVMTPALMNTEMYAVVRMSDPGIFNKDNNVVVAVNEGNPNYEAFLVKHFPEWKKVYFANSEACLKGVAEGKADCLIISNYRYNNIARMCKKYHLTTFSIGVELDYCMAVTRGRVELYSVLAKVISMVPDAAVHASFSHYITEESQLTFTDFIIDNLGVFIVITSIIMLTILFLLFRSITSERKANSLIQATELDDLTGLYNRKYFFQYAYRMYRDHPDKPLDAIVLNIEHFRSVNELHGRELGDEILRGLGIEIKKIADEENGIAGRFEADRFDIYCNHKEDYEAIFDRLQTVVNQLAFNANARLRMGVMPWQSGMEPIELFDRARTACNMARGNYKKHLIIYDETVSKRDIFEQRLLNDLRQALDNEEFEVFYQPKFNIQNEPFKLVSAEALVRWHHPDLGLIEPGDFIPLFENNGQITLLDKYVWAKAARMIACWKEKYGVTLSISVNLSRVDIFDLGLEETLYDIMETNNLNYDDLKLEITESAYTENADQVIQVIGRLRNKGFKVEMDDFGSGYSSLNMLSSMPIDVLKMDREFIRNIDHDQRGQQLVELIIDIAKNLKIPVIAEGVERETQIQILKKMGCDIVQGFYFSRPLPVDEFEKRFLITE